MCAHVLTATCLAARSAITDATSLLDIGVWDYLQQRSVQLLTYTAQLLDSSSDLPPPPQNAVAALMASARARRLPDKYTQEQLEKGTADHTLWNAVLHLLQSYYFVEGWPATELEAVGKPFVKQLVKVRTLSAAPGSSTLAAAYGVR